MACPATCPNAAPATNPLDLMYVWRGEAQDDDDSLNTKFYFPGRFSLFGQNCSGINGAGVLQRYRPPVNGVGWPNTLASLNTGIIPTVAAPIGSYVLAPNTRPDQYALGYVSNSIIGKLYVHYSVQLVAKEIGIWK